VENKLTKIVNLNKNEYTVYIGRGSIWGNPFIIGKDGTRKEVIEKCKQHVMNSPELMKRLHELEGETLGCFCKPKLCHGDVLIELIEENRSKTDASTLDKFLF